MKSILKNMRSNFVRFFFSPLFLDVTHAKEKKNIKNVMGGVFNGEER